MLPNRNRESSTQSGRRWNEFAHYPLQKSEKVQLILLWKSLFRCACHQQKFSWKFRCGCLVSHKKQPFALALSANDWFFSTKSNEINLWNCVIFLDETEVFCTDN